MAVTYSQNGVIVRENKVDGSIKIGDLWYRTVKIGDQVWLGENLEYRDSSIALNPTGTPTTASCWTYSTVTETGHFGKKWGYLYNSAAVDYIESNKETICPGWHVPTIAEWSALGNYVGGFSVDASKKLKATATWNAYTGTDEFGMTILPSGYRSIDGNLDGNYRFAYYFCSNRSNGLMTDVLFPSDADRMWSGTLDDKVGAALRLVKDS